jgi:hypothetical protein
LTPCAFFNKASLITDYPQVSRKNGANSQNLRKKGRGSFLWWIFADKWLKKYAF